jgi:hypothetical protein
MRRKTGKRRAETGKKKAWRTKTSAAQLRAQIDRLYDIMVDRDTEVVLLKLMVQRWKRIAMALMEHTEGGRRE